MIIVDVNEVLNKHSVDINEFGSEIAEQVKRCQTALKMGGVKFDDDRLHSTQELGAHLLEMLNAIQNCQGAIEFIKTRYKGVITL
jgi:hypothetical protein